MKAEQFTSEKIALAFPEMKNLSDESIERNPYIFESLSACEAVELIPAYMVYALKNLRSNPGSMVYLQLITTINNYSKCKNPGDTHAGLWFILSVHQKKAMLAFLGHLANNQPANIDAHELNKIIKRWQSVT
ncbi:hypothetical protein [Ectopseudomonas mendocina]|uniref:Uncharacterized protein n=1 Tax=Ectopseudomonas mendocina TaxID=300 RepID=A0A2R3QIQ7_ECTME|nr:hypothetical protein [Pseudomonas mendocina]AVO51624.1 hypothetical protein C7A17_02195 [Pseudomonas mendocina]